VKFVKTGRGRSTALGVVALLFVLCVGVAVGRGSAPDVVKAAGAESDGAVSGGSISVNGQATVKVAPDTVSFGLGVQSQAATAGEAMDQCSEAMTRIVNALVTAGVPKTAIQTANISLYPQYDYGKEGSSGRIVGYQASNQLTVTWTRLDIGKLGDVIDAAVKAGANTVSGISFSVADTQSLYLQAIGEAVRDARAKADALAAAAGVKVGAVKNMSLDSYSGGPVIMKSLQAGAAEAVPVEPGTVEIQVSVHVEYGIQ